MHKVRKLLRNKKALTALQTAILTGVGIAVALIVGYWVWTVVVGSIRTERLNLTIPSAVYSDSAAGIGDKGWEIKFKIKNVGPSDATIIDVRINGKSYEKLSGDVYIDLEYTTGDTEANQPPYPIKAGDETTALISIKLDGFKHGQTIEIAIVTASNQVYTASVSLP